MNVLVKWYARILVALLVACLAVLAELNIPRFDSDLATPSPQIAVVSSTPAAIPSAVQTVLPPPAGQLVFAAERNGQWDLYATTPDGNARQRLTDDGSSRAPAISRDGARVAFESHRDGNWEIYVIDSNSGAATRLTRTPAFDGRPSWAPDGKRIAFASIRQEDLDIWVMNTDGSEARDLTKESPSVDDEPKWSPDGRWIAFTSWRTNTAQIFALAPDGTEIFNLSQNKFNERSPAWSPDGKQIAFVSDRDGQPAIYVAEFSTSGMKNVRRLTFSDWDESPVWSPDGQYLAFVSPRPARQPVYLVRASGGMPVPVSSDSPYIQSVAWANRSGAFATRSVTAPATPLYTEPDPATSAKLVPLKEVYLAPSYGEMSDRVSASFLALRARVRSEVGWDFLGVLSDMARQLTGECGDGCDILSWHKAGRAVDTRMEVDSGGVPMLEIVREDQLGETYWRIYLRTAKQDGTQGEPLTATPWDWTYTARWTLAPYQGGVPKAIPAGYYVDFTELAREYGWERISSYDDETLSWKENITGLEFWHHQNTGGLTWYPALRELYSEQVLAATFDWNTLRKQGEDAYMLRLKDLPGPANAWTMFALLP